MSRHVVITADYLAALAKNEALVAQCPALARYRSAAQACGSCGGAATLTTINAESAERDVRAALADASPALRSLLLAVMAATSAEIQVINPLTGKIEKRTIAPG